MLDVHQQKRCCLTSTVVYRLFFLWHLSFKRSPCLWPPDRLSGAVKRKLLDVHCTSLRKSKFAAASGPMTRMSSISSGAEYDAWDQQWRGGLEMLLKMRGWQLEMKSCGPWKPTKIQRWFGLWIHIKWLPRTWYLIVVNSLPFQAASKSIWTSFKNRGTIGRDPHLPAIWTQEDVDALNEVVLSPGATAPLWDGNDELPCCRVNFPLTYWKIWQGMWWNCVEMLSKTPMSPWEKKTQMRWRYQITVIFFSHVWKSGEKPRDVFFLQIANWLFSYCW